MLFHETWRAMDTYVHQISKIPVYVIKISKSTHSWGRSPYNGRYKIHSSEWQNFVSSLRCHRSFTVIQVSIISVPWSYRQSYQSFTECEWVWQCLLCIQKVCESFFLVEVGLLIFPSGGIILRNQKSSKCLFLYDHLSACPDLATQIMSDSDLSDLVVFYILPWRWKWFLSQSFWLV